ncbi:hypothetical protein GJ744_011851 [Endocarpon pusillum]|uniref:Uncharacterized protein n=1 Tax=Endocarpon pusillum TaxID=364733 RepID=A0A8H7AC29_9EURO|nr:hypothetical protein GJ744_011851 [Endocarpon pusillum]
MTFSSKFLLSRRSFAAMATTSKTPVEDLIRSKITEELRPTTLEIFNDSAAHSHHQAMAGISSRETHFRLNIVSHVFQSKMQPARHRMVYAILREELDRPGGIHALQLRTKTPEEDEKQQSREQG